MAACLTCEEIELRICELDVEISSGTCGGLIVREGDTTFDHSPEIKAKIEVLRIYRDLHKTKCGSGAGELYEFVHVPCVKPYTCQGSSCSTVSGRRVDRRYRR
jgi:hypothetical protein